MDLLAYSRCPGKLLLSGEHSTVYGKNAVAVTVDLYTSTKIYTISEPILTLNLKNLNHEISWNIDVLNNIQAIVEPLNNDSKFTKNSIFSFNENVLQTVTDLLSLSLISDNSKNDLIDEICIKNSCLAFLLLYISITDRSFYYFRKPMKVEVESNIPNGAGLGSSSSYIVSLARALFDACNVQIEKQSFNQWCYEIDKLFHGKPSGVDNTICTFGGAILFRQGKIVQQISHDDLQSLSSINVLLVNTGVSRNTKAMVQRCQQKLNQLPDQGKILMDQISNISQKIWDSIKDNHFSDLPDLFTKNQKLLNDIDVGHEKIDEIIDIAKSFGYSAKLTGAGGGGIVFVYIPTESNLSDLKNELKMRNFKTYSVKIGVAGVEALPDGSENNE